MAYGYKNFATIPSDDRLQRTCRYDFLCVLAPYDAAAGATTAGTVVSGGSLNNSGSTLTIISGTAQPQEGYARELVFVQNENSGSALSVSYTVKVITIFGRTITFTFRMATDSKRVLSYPILKVVSIVTVVTNGAASDVVNVGWRGYFLDQSWLVTTPYTVDQQILMESLNGSLSSTITSTIPANGFYLPSSIAAGQRITLVVYTISDSDQLTTIAQYQLPTTVPLP